MKNDIIIVTADKNNMTLLAEALSQNIEIGISCAASGAEALEVAKTLSPSLVIIDENLPDTEGLDLVRSLLSVNAMINTAVVSSLSPDAFHEASEGLGVMVLLPRAPAQKEAAEIIEKLG